MTRDLDVNDEEFQWDVVGAEHWTDYDRAMPYGDFNVTFGLQGDPVVGERMRYLEGFGLPAQQTVSTSATQYLHGDLIRSTMLTTGQGGTAVSAVSYTAFGEVIGTAPDTRYQYAGGWGYETGGFGDDPGLLVLNGAPGTAPITLQHVGHRWYDPSIGRFIQRDPIGIFGGLNVYEYVRSNPVSRVDPVGLDPRTVVEGLHYMLVDEYQQTLADGAAQTVYVYQLQLLFVTYEDYKDELRFAGIGSAVLGLQGLAWSALGGPAGIGIYLACVGLAVAVGGGVASEFTPVEVSREWVDVGDPFHTTTPLKAFPYGLPRWP